MRIASLLTLLLGAVLLPAQETTTKIKTVGAKPTSVASGKEMFHAYCASCHGHGSKDMPVWGPILSTVSSDTPAVVTQRIGNLIGYIESLQAK